MIPLNCKKKGGNFDFHKQLHCHTNHSCAFCCCCCCSDMLVLSNWLS